MYSGNQASYDNLSKNMKQKLEGLKTPIVNDLTTGGSDKALSAESGKELKSLVDEKADSEDLKFLQTEVTEHLAEMKNEIDEHSKKIASTSELGHIKVGKNLTLTSDGTLNASGGTVSDASTSQKGIVQLNDTLTSTSITQAATANAVKQVNYKITSLDVALGSGASGSNAAPTTGFVAIGGNASVKGARSVTIGVSSSSEHSSVVIGGESTGGAGNVTIGHRAKGMNNSVSIGEAATGDGTSAVNVGASSKSDSYGTALGTNARSSTDAVSIGYGAKATAPGSVAIGEASSSSNENEGVLGSDTSYASKWKVPGSFSVTGTKQFEMPHPKPDLMHTHVLRHGAVESPTAGDTLYRYFISLKGNEAMIRTAGLSNYVIVPIEQKDRTYSISVTLPDYWVWLNENEQVTVSPDRHFGSGYGYVNRMNESLELTFNELKDYHAILYGTRNDNHESVQTWKVKGAVREVGESWTGETYLFEIEEYKEITEFKEEY